MKNKLVIVLLTTALLLSACGNSQPANSSNVNTQSTEQQGEQKDELQELTWIQLYDLDTYQDTLRAPMEYAVNLGHFYDPTVKAGVLYRNQFHYDAIRSNTLYDVLNHQYPQSRVFKRPETISAIAEAANNTYKDLANEDEMAQFCMGINGYFNLLPDTVDGNCQPNKELTRAEFMALIFRADTSAHKEIVLSKAFEEKVGESQYNLYAQGIEYCSYVVLDKNTYNEPITVKEVCYMLNKRYLDQQLSYDKKFGSFVPTIQQGDMDDKLYKAIVAAEYFECIDSEIDLEDTVTKAEAIRILINVYQKINLPTAKFSEHNGNECKIEVLDIGIPIIGNGMTIEEQENITVFYDLTEDTNGDGLIDFEEDMSDGWWGYTLHYNDDGSNTTYFVDLYTGQIIHPGDWFTDHNGQRGTWMGTTPEDHEMANQKLAEEYFN